MSFNSTLKKYRFLDSACISDALDSLGLSNGLLGIHLRVENKKVVGPAFTVKYRELTKEEKGNFQNAGNYIDVVPEGAIIVIDNKGRKDCTSWGRILTEYALKKKIGGTIVHGSARDIEEIKKLKYPIFSSEIFMQSGKNRVRMDFYQQKITIGNVDVYPDDLIFGDENGCLVIPQKLILEVLKRAEIVKKNENKILSEIKRGKNLQIARKNNNYSTPWVKKD